MTRRVSLSSWGNHPNKPNYDLFISSIGYETRARFIAESLQPHASLKVACGFEDNKVHSYFDNLTWYQRNNYVLEERQDDEYETWCHDVLSSVSAAASGTIRVGVDISSMSRFRIAAVAAALFDHDTAVSYETDFLYAPSRFLAPSDEEGPIIICKPVIDKLAGWSIQPEKPTMAIFGLGYECDKALGALEYIEAASVWAFLPSGEDKRYDSAMVKANQGFWESLPKTHVFDYRVDDPIDCFTNLEGLLYGKLNSNKPVLVPFGPKLFALNCLLVAFVYYPRVAVWRVSSGPYEPAIDRLPNGRVVGLTVRFDADESPKDDSFTSEFD